MVPELLGLATPPVRAAVEGWIGDQGLVVRESWPLGELDAWRRAFSTWQAWEAWQVRGAWLAERLDTLGPDVRGRFAAASAVSRAEADEPRRSSPAPAPGARARRRRVLVLPSAPSVAPLIGEDLGRVREATLALTCLAGSVACPRVAAGHHQRRAARGRVPGRRPGSRPRLLALAASLAAAGTERVTPQRPGPPQPGRRSRVAVAGPPQPDGHCRRTRRQRPDDSP